MLIAIGYSLYIYTYQNKEDKENMIDENNSPVQLINQIKGYFHINPFIAISLSITLFSFVGVPPITGFFAKQMILSSALDNGYVFMSLVAILTSVIGAAYYLNLIKQMFFYKSSYVLNPDLSNYNNIPYVSYSETNKKTNIYFTPENITINSSLSGSISVLTLLLLSFIYIPGE
jgi:NADH-ubiquinone oxidoreductase chain 2